MSSELGARETAKRATRLALIRAAMLEFAAHGFDAPSLDSICARAGYTRGAFYVHFECRDDLVAAVMEHALRAFVDAVVAGGEADDDLETTVRRFIGSALGVAPAFVLAANSAGARPTAFVRAHRKEEGGVTQLDAEHEIWAPPFYQLLQACQRSPAVREAFLVALGEATKRLVAAARRGQTAGRVRSDLDSARVADILILLALGVQTAIDVELPMDLARARDSALALLRD